MGSRCLRAALPPHYLVTKRRPARTSLWVLSAQVLEEAQQSQQDPSQPGLLGGSSRLWSLPLGRCLSYHLSGASSLRALAPRHSARRAQLRRASRGGRIRLITTNGLSTWQMATLQGRTFSHLSQTRRQCVLSAAIAAHRAKVNS